MDMVLLLREIRGTGQDGYVIDDTSAKHHPRRTRGTRNTTLPHLVSYYDANNTGMPHI